MEEIIKNLINQSNLETEIILDKEDDDGWIEYKIHLVDIDQNKFQKLVTQMSWRIEEGNGKCYYYIGINDNGIPSGISENYLTISLKNLKKMSEYLKLFFKIIYIKKGQIENCFCCKILIYS